MLYYKSRSQEELSEALLNYQLNLELPNHIESEWDLAEYVYLSCEKLIPKTFLDLFKKEIDIFINDLCFHLIFHCFATLKTEGKSNYVNSYGLLRTADELLLKIEKNNSKENRDGNRFRNAVNNLKNKIGDEFSLPQSDKRFSIPKILSPYISYAVINYKMHKVLKENKETKSNTLRKFQKINEKFHLQYYDEFVYFMDKFEKNENLNELFGSDYIKYTLLNKIFFEKEYNLGLVSKIFAMCTVFDKNEQFYKYLSISALFPNVNGRLFYLSKLLTCIKLSEGSFLSKRDLRDFIMMATLVIPIMESLFIYLWRSFEVKFGDLEILEIMKKYESKVFSMRKIALTPQLFSNKKLREKKGENKQIYTYQLYNVWEIADVPFKDIYPIIKNVNSIKVLQTKMSEIFLSPKEYLISNRNYDRYRVLTFIENPLNLIEVVADEIILDFFGRF